MLNLIAAFLLQTAVAEPCAPENTVPHGDASLVITQCENTPLPGVAVTIKCSGFPRPLTLVTNAHGLATFAPASTGECVVSVAMRGFLSGKPQRFVSASAPVTLTFAMPVAATKCPTFIDPVAFDSNAPGRYTFGQSLVRHLPISRDLSAIVSLAPGVH